MGTVNRRGFLAAALGALAYDPERALWTPGKKLISIPRPVDLYAFALRELNRMPGRMREDFAFLPPEEFDRRVLASLEARLQLKFHPHAYTLIWPPLGV
jgi:hypothetical protein